MALIQREVLVALVIIISTTLSSAQTWNGAGANGNWTTAQNWVGNVAPISGPNTYLVFEGAVRPTCFADTNSPWLLNRIDFETRVFGGQNSFVVSGNQLSFQGASQIFVYAGASQTINNDIEIAGANLRVESLTGQSITLNGHISGPGGLTIAQANALLTNSNNYQGTTRIGSSPLTGAVTVSNGHALGASGGGGVILGLGSQIRLSGGIIVDSKPLTMSSGSGFNSNGLKNVGGNNVWTGPISLSFTAGIWSQSAGETLTVSGDIEGNNNSIQMGGIGDIVVSGAIRNLHWDLSKYGTGALTLAGNNSNIDQIIVADGTLVAARSSALPYNTPIQLIPNSGVPLQNAYPTLRIEEDTTIGGLSGHTSGGTTTVQLGSHILTINQAFYSYCPATFTGSGSIVKTGVGVLELGGVSDFTGGSVISGGALRISQDRALGAVPAEPTVNLTVNGGELQPSPSSGSVNAQCESHDSASGPRECDVIFSASAPYSARTDHRARNLDQSRRYGVTLSNPNNSYTGGTFINAGTLKFDDPGAIAAHRGR